MISRKIYFYSVEDLEGNIFDSNELQDIFENLRNGIKSSPYEPLDDNGNTVCRCWTPPKITLPFRARWGKIRRKDLPTVEEDGKVTHLNLNPKAGLSDMTHAIFFNDSIAAIEFNYHGPRVKLIENYILAKAGKALQIKPLFDAEVLAKVDDIEALSKIDISVRSAELEKINLNRLGPLAALKSLSSSSNSSIIRLCVSVGSSNTEINQGFLQSIKKFFFGEEANYMFKSAKVSGYTSDGEKIDKLDLLNEFIVSTQDVLTVKESRRSVDTNDIFAKMTSARTSVNKKIKKAMHGD